MCLRFLLLSFLILICGVMVSAGVQAQTDSTGKKEKATSDSSYRRVWKLDFVGKKFGNTDGWTWMWKLNKSTTSHREWRPAQITLWVPAKYPRHPVIGTNGRRSEYISNTLSINLTAGVNGGVRGLETGLVANINNGDVYGVQLSGITNITQGKVGGIQVAGIANVSDKSAGGILLAGITNVSSRHTAGIIASGIANVSNGRMDGILMSGFANVSSGKMRGIALSGISNVGTTMGGVFVSGVSNVAGGRMVGVALSGIANVSNGSMRAIAVSGIANVSNGRASGILISGISNVSNGSTQGVHASGIANVTNGDFYGVQVSGLANVVSSDLAGVQVGLVNVASRLRGIQLGLINVVQRNGYIRSELSASEVFQLGYALKSGKRYLYNIASAGVQLVGPAGSQPRWGLGWGLGTNHTIGRSVSVGLDVIWHYLNENQLWTRAHFSSLSTARLTAGWLIGPKWELFAGPTLNWLVSNRVNEDSTVGGRVNPFAGTATSAYANASTQQWWVGGIIGFRYSINKF